MVTSVSGHYSWTCMSSKRLDGANASLLFFCTSTAGAVNFEREGSVIRHAYFVFRRLYAVKCRNRCGSLEAEEVNVHHHISYLAPSSCHRLQEVSFLHQNLVVEGKSRA